jgi:hypothetical protein
MGPGLEALLGSVGYPVAKRGADEMADRYLIENREAAVGRMHSKLHQPPTTPCLYLASPAWCTSHFVVV